MKKRDEFIEGMKIPIYLTMLEYRFYFDFDLFGVEDEDW